MSEVWIVGDPDDGARFPCLFLGAYATEDEAWAVVKDTDYLFMFRWELGAPLRGGGVGELGDVRWCEKVVERRRLDAGREELKASRPPPAEPEYEVLANPDGTTTVRIKPPTPPQTPLDPPSSRSKM